MGSKVELCFSVAEPTEKSVGRGMEERVYGQMGGGGTLTCVRLVSFHCVDYLSRGLVACERFSFSFLGDAPMSSPLLFLST